MYEWKQGRNRDANQNIKLVHMQCKANNLDECKREIASHTNITINHKLAKPKLCIVPNAWKRKGKGTKKRPLMGWWPYVPYPPCGLTMHCGGAQCVPNFGNTNRDAWRWLVLSNEEKREEVGLQRKVMVVECSKTKEWHPFIECKHSTKNETIWSNFMGCSQGQCLRLVYTLLYSVHFVSICW